MKGIYQFAANLFSYIPTKYYWNRSTSDLVIAKSKRVKLFETQCRPGLVTLYDIWPGNGAGLFLQPRSPHGVTQERRTGQQLLQLSAKVAEFPIPQCLRIPSRNSEIWIQIWTTSKI